MDEKNKAIARTFNTKIRTSWVWLVLAMTVGLTALFYFSQKPQIILYSSFIKSLSDYHLQESYVMRSMDRLRVGLDLDTSAIQLQTMSLREMAVSVSREIDAARNQGERAPSQEAVTRFEREALGKVAVMKRYVSRRVEWFESFRECNRLTYGLAPSVQSKLHDLLDSARSGRLVVLNADGDEEISALPDSVRGPFARLLQENEELSMAWSAFNNDMAVAYSEDLIHFFQMESLNEISLKGKIPMAFYFLSLVLLLSTFFFVLYARR